MNIGIDIEEVKRFKKYESDGERLKRVFSEQEIKYCLSKTYPAQHLAARFAAKEAVWKALNSKLKNLVVLDITIKNLKSGQPQVYIKGKKQNKILLSLTHTKNYAAAAAVFF
jgi:holo-[acyl-carrier protein] synthase